MPKKKFTIRKKRSDGVLNQNKARGVLDPVTRVCGRYHTHFTESSTSSFEIAVACNPRNFDSRLLDMSDDWEFFRLERVDVTVSVRLPRTNEQTLGFLYSPLFAAWAPAPNYTTTWDKNVIWTAPVYKQGSPYREVSITIPKKLLYGDSVFGWRAVEAVGDDSDSSGTIYGGWLVQDADSGGAVMVDISYEILFRGPQDPAVSFAKRLARMQRNGELLLSGSPTSIVLVQEPSEEDDQEPQPVAARPMATTVVPQPSVRKVPASFSFRAVSHT